MLVQCCSGQYRSAAGNTGSCTLCENQNAYTSYKDYRFTVISTLDSLKRVRINELNFYDENDAQIASATSSCSGCSGKLTDGDARISTGFHQLPPPLPKYFGEGIQLFTNNAKFSQAPARRSFINTSCPAKCPLKQKIIFTYILIMKWSLAKTASAIRSIEALCIIDSKVCRQGMPLIYFYFQAGPSLLLG